MRTGAGITYQFCRISDRGTVVAIVGVGCRLPEVPDGAPRGPASQVVEDEIESFGFHATRGHEILPHGGEDIHGALAAFNGDIVRFRAECPSHLKVSKPVTCVSRLLPSWTVGAEIEHRYMLEVLGKKPEALKFLEPPRVWTRELPVLEVFPLVAKEK